VRDRLIQQRQRIAHAAGRGAPDELQRIRLEGDALGLQKPGNMADDGSRRHLLQIELQAPRQHGHRDLLRIGGGEDEFQVLRRLLERLQHGVERGIRQHVHFVDHVHLEAAARRRVLRRVEQLPHLIDTRVGRRVDLQEIDEAPAVDLLAGAAATAGLGGDASFAVKALGQNARQCGLAHAAGAREQIGMVQALVLQRVAQRAHHVLLPHQRRETARAPLAREHLIGHALDFIRGVEGGPQSPFDRHGWRA